jgi:hypothetical protein
LDVRAADEARPEVEAVRMDGFGGEGRKREVETFPI